MWRTRVDGVDSFNFTVRDERPPRQQLADGLLGGLADGLLESCRWTAGD